VARVCPVPAAGKLVEVVCNCGGGVPTYLSLLGSGLAFAGLVTALARVDAVTALWLCAAGYVLSWWVLLIVQDNAPEPAPKEKIIYLSHVDTYRVFDYGAVHDYITDYTAQEYSWFQRAWLSHVAHGDLSQEKMNVRSYKLFVRMRERLIELGLVEWKANRQGLLLTEKGVRNARQLFKDR
jgi:hypothetical protein